MSAPIHITSPLKRLVLTSQPQEHFVTFSDVEHLEREIRLFENSNVAIESNEFAPSTKLNLVYYVQRTTNDKIDIFFKRCKVSQQLRWLTIECLSIYSHTIQLLATTFPMLESLVIQTTSVHRPSIRDMKCAVLSHPLTYSSSN